VLSICHKRITVVREGEQHTQNSNPQHTHAHKPRLELKTQHREYATQTELKSLTQSIKCVEAESESLRMFLVSLVSCSMRFGVLFIAPRQLGAVGDQHGRLSLPSVEWRTGQSGAPPDNHCSMSGARTPSKSGAADRCSSESFGAPDNVRCTSRPLERATCRALIARTTVGAGTVGSPDSPVHHWTVR
jgi:hypothetical protein